MRGPYCFAELFRMPRVSLKGARPVSLAKLAIPAILLLAAGGCTKAGDITEGGITAVRTPCPRVAVPVGTGDVTLFNPATSRTADAIDVVASISNVESTCNAEGPQVATTISFDVLGRRSQPGPARDVTLPYFVSVVRGGSQVTAKRVAQVTLHFAEGALRAQAKAEGVATVDHAAATLPADVRRRLTEKRKAGDEAAAVDPLNEPSVRQAVLSATFEALVGFQLTEDQLKYNLTR